MPVTDRPTTARSRAISPISALALVVLVGCGATPPADDEIPIIADDAEPGVDGSRDASPDGVGGGDAIAPRDTAAAGDASLDAAPTTDIGPVVDAPRETAADACTGVATAPFQPPTTCTGPSGYTSTEIPKNHVYATSWFGCYRKTDGTIYKDPTDNCLFACGSRGLCASSLSGPECEATLKWFAADADRYGCGGRIRVTNCVNGRSVILATLDRGPNCKTVEQAYGAPALDMSYPAMVHLFEGKTYGVSDKKRVLVEAVPDTTPLGPE